eukprot:UN06745
MEEENVLNMLDQNKMMRNLVDQTINSNIGNLDDEENMTLDNLLDKSQEILLERDEIEAKIDEQNTCQNCFKMNIPLNGHKRHTYTKGCACGYVAKTLYDLQLKAGIEMMKPWSKVILDRYMREYDFRYRVKVEKPAKNQERQKIQSLGPP